MSTQEQDESSNANVKERAKRDTEKNDINVSLPNTSKHNQLISK